MIPPPHKILARIAGACYHLEQDRGVACVIGCIGAVYRVQADPYKNKLYGFRWQSGSLLIAGALVIWGSLLSNVGICTSTINLTSVLIALIFTAWILYAHHYRQMYMTKLFRIHEIEKILNMELNKKHGFLGVPKGGYSKFGPKGHIIDMFVYILVSLFGPFLASIQKNSHFPLVFSVLVIAITIWIVNNNEKRMIESYKEKLKTS